MSHDEMIEGVKTALSKLSPERKIYVLSLLAHNLTISGRGVYSDRNRVSETIEKYYTLNELLHRVSSQLMHLSSGDEAAEPDESFIQSLYDRACEGGCEVELRSALRYSILI